jgi:hypothetical protein
MSLCPVVVRAFGRGIVCAVWFFASACGGGGGGSTSAGPPIPPVTPPAGPLVWVVNEFASALDGFALDATGNAAPAAVIRTNEQDMFGLTYVPDGTLHYARLFGQPNTTDLGAVQSVSLATHAVLSKITGPSTALGYPVSVALDGAGTIYVSNGSGITEYAPGANGDAVPIRRITGQYTGGYGVVADAAGNVWLPCCGGAIVSFAAGASGNATPRTLVGGSQTHLNGPEQIALAQGKIYVANRFGQSVLVFDAAANGDAAPLQAIAGPHTQLDGPRGIAVAADGSIYVSNVNANSITVYAPNATGDAAPRAVIGGALTSLDFPGALAISR